MHERDDCYLPELTWKANPAVAAIARLVLATGMRNCKGLVFVASTGRSGTTSLAKVLSLVEGCKAFHEPWPFMNGHRLVNRQIPQDEYARRIYSWRKALSIRRRARHCKYYVESSHLFIKSFCDYVFDDFGPLVKVVHLMRDPEKIARSMVSLDTIPGNEAAGPWYFDWKSDNNIITLPSLPNAKLLESDPLTLCLWYCYELEARVQYWRSRQPSIPFVDFHIEDLDKLEALIALTEKLDMICEPGVLENAVNTRLNLKESRKSEVETVSLSDTEVRDAHLRLRACLSRGGHTLPHVFDRYLA